MKGVNKKARLIIITLILIECFSIFLTYKSFENKKINEDIKKYEFNKNTFAIYVEKDDNYEEVKDGFWPDTTYAYRYNEEKSYCVNNNNEKLLDVLFFDNNQKEAKVVTRQTVYCYLYFDKRLDIKIDVPETNISKKIGLNKELSCNGANGSWNYKNNSLLISSVSSKNAKCTVSYGNTRSGTKLTDVVKSDVMILLNNFFDQEIIKRTFYYGIEDGSDHSDNTKISSDYGRKDYGYRYFNSKNFVEPNNYIWFNNELWRIIGSIPTKKSDGTTTNLVKIIRNTSIGSYQYDIHGTGVYWKNISWGTSKLYNLLNEEYYKSLSGNDSKTCKYYTSSSWANKSSCDFTYTGLNSNPMIEKVYWNVGTTSSDKNAIASLGLEDDAIQIGYVGLLSPSDYGFAFWANREVVEISGITIAHITPYFKNIKLDRLCAGSGVNGVPGSKKVWLYSQMTEPTINRTSNGLNTLSIRGCISEYDSKTENNDIVNIPTSVRPVVYLKESVYKVGGTGTITDPYQIAMN